MAASNNPLVRRLRYHVTGAIERGEGEAIVEMRMDVWPGCTGAWQLDSDGRTAHLEHHGDTCPIHESE